MHQQFSVYVSDVHAFLIGLALLASVCIDNCDNHPTHPFLFISCFKEIVDERRVPIQGMPLLRVEDLTEEALTKVFREYFNLKTLSISIEEQAREFTGVNDQFQSEIKKLAVKIKKDDKEEAISMVVKTTPRTSVQRIIQRLTRPFLSEVMWYSQVQILKISNYSGSTSLSSNSLVSSTVLERYL